jgi:hypothetical protein
MRAHAGIQYAAASPRHCERSEAIHSFFVPGHGLLRFARNDGWMQFRILAALIARGLHFVVPLENRGRREDRVRAAPAVSRAKCANKNAHEHTGSAEAFRPSLRNGFTAYFVLSPVNGSFATVAPEKLASRRT